MSLDADSPLDIHLCVNLDLSLYLDLSPFLDSVLKSNLSLNPKLLWAEGIKVSLLTKT